MSVCCWRCSVSFSPAIVYVCWLLFSTAFFIVCEESFVFGKTEELNRCTHISCLCILRCATFMRARFIVSCTIVCIGRMSSFYFDHFIFFSLKTLSFHTNCFVCVFPFALFPFDVPNKKNRPHILMCCFRRRSSACHCALYGSGNSTVLQPIFTTHITVI